jgi:chromosome segregation ATPase
MATQDLQSLRAELQDLEGELHGIAAKIERIEQERADGRSGAGLGDAELSAAREEQRTYESRRAELRRQIAELEGTLEDY